MNLGELANQLNEKELKKLNDIFYKKQKKVPTFQYSKIKDSDLKQLFKISNNLDSSIFNHWFKNNIELDYKTINFLKKLIDQTSKVIERYNEEDLKMKFLSKILNRIEFESYEKGYRDFYELPLTYKTDKFILTGLADIVISKGYVESEKPYFFIQEFKKAEYISPPRPQLLAELITGIELNHWQFMKGAYITGGNWHFVILEKLAENTYQYFISQNFDSTKVEDLKMIYKNLLFVKNEINEY